MLVSMEPMQVRKKQIKYFIEHYDIKDFPLLTMLSDPKSFVDDYLLLKDRLLKRWLEEPSYRFIQILINTSLFPNLPGMYYYIQDETWLDTQGIDCSKYLTWTSIYDKNRVLLTKPITRFICDLEEDHIKAILQEFENKLNPILKKWLLILITKN